MKFKYQEWRERKQQEFDKDNITLTKAGKTFNVYDAIQEAREDTEIYPTLEKYGCIEKVPMYADKVYNQLQQFNDLRDLKEQQSMAEQMLYDLPLEVRQEFNNDMNQFAKNGEKYIKKILDNKAKEEKVQKPQQQETPKQETAKQEVKNNE